MDYQKCIELHKTIKNKSEVARQLNLAQAVANKYLQHGFKPFVSNARYWSDLKKTKEWFLTI